MHEFQIDPSAALALIEPHFTAVDIEPTTLERWSNIIDYGWLSDANRTERTTVVQTPQTLNPGNWNFFEDLIGDNVDGSVDMVGGGLNTLMHDRSGSLKDWWVDTW